MRHPDQVKQYLKEDEYKVYKLIWQRFVASQMNAGGFRPDHRRHRRNTKDGRRRYRFRVTGSVLKFDGFLRVYEESKEGKDEKTKN